VGPATALSPSSTLRGGRGGISDDVNGVPVGLMLIQQGWANARYDSLDGYDRHIHQDEYRAADGPHNCGIGAD
jgi:hypothetical protein